MKSNKSTRNTKIALVFLLINYKKKTN